MRGRFTRRTGAVAAAFTATLGALAPAAGADAVYHTQHMRLQAVDGAQLRSGFVQNIKANGPTVYAHEVYVLKGASPNTSYTVTNHFYFEDPACADPTNDFPTDTALLRTNRSGNARADFFFAPEDAAGLEGLHGVLWTVQIGDGEPLYQTGCSAVTLD